MRRMFTALLSAGIALLGHSVYAQDFGACQEIVSEMTSKGGAVLKMTDSVQNHTTFDVTYAYEGGGVFHSGFDPAHDPNWKKMSLSDQNKERAQILAHLAQETDAIKNGRMWFIIANRAVWPGLRPLFSMPGFPGTSTKWRPYYAFISNEGVCVANYLDWAVFEHHLPEYVQKLLRQQT